MGGRDLNKASKEGTGAGASTMLWQPPVKGFPPVPSTPPSSTQPARAKHKTGRGKSASEDGDDGLLRSDAEAGGKPSTPRHTLAAARTAGDAGQHSRPPLAAETAPSPPPGAAAPASRSPHRGHHLQQLRHRRPLQPGRQIQIEPPAATRGEGGRWSCWPGESRRGAGGGHRAAASATACPAQQPPSMRPR